MAAPITAAPRHRCATASTSGSALAGSGLGPAMHRGEVTAKPVRLHLEHVQRLGEPGKAVLAQAAKADAGPGAGRRAALPAHPDLPAMGRGCDSWRGGDRESDPAGLAGRAPP